MGPFALSVPSYRLGVHPHKRRHGDAARRDAEARSPSPHTDSDAETQFSSTSRLPSETINPLSHSPDTLRQLAVAGLAPEDELPSRAHPGFPHKPLPSSSSSSRRRRGGRRAALSSDGGGSGAETDSTIASQRSRRIDNVDGKQHSARMRHLNTMTAIMHRCLRDGDIARAKRALGLLVRTRDVDLRVDNLWAIGSEILMRDGEVEAIVEQKEPDIAETGEGQGGGEDGASAKESPRPPHRWGSAANVSRVKQYFETLIQHHPYDGHRPQLTSAVDFWPALFGIEVYNLDAEMQSALYHIYIEHGFPSSSSRSPSPAREYDDYEADRMDIDDDDNHNHNYEGRRGSELEEGHSRDRHDATDALRAETQRGALEIAARMDGVLENPPYNAHAELLRLRAHVSLFIGDLYLPSRLVERYAAQCKREGRPQKVSLRDAAQQLRKQVRAPEEHVAVARRREEQERARVFFRRVVGAKGRLEDWILQFVDADEEDGDDGEELRHSRW